MITFFSSILLLILGYIFYGKFTENVFHVDDRPTPAISMEDSVDHVPLKPWRAFLIQLLNIAGTGPIFGALMGATFGPIVFLWIILGSILGGAVHDFMAGAISCRNGGIGLVEIAREYFGDTICKIMRIFIVIVLILVVAVFSSSPTSLLAKITHNILPPYFWMIVIIAYYLISAILPVDKLIAKIYPLFGIFLAIMATSILGVIFLGDYTLPELTLENQHPNDLPAWPFMFITVACGAISGFHATQAPIIAKCITSERQSRKVFYGAMLVEAVIALIWATAGMTFYGTTQALNNALTAEGQAGVVYEMSNAMLGDFGGTLAILGAVVCPITTGDTALRAARLALSEQLHVSQVSLKNRLLITLPLIAIAVLITQLDYSIVWRYFAWANQLLAMFILWVCSAYLIKNSSYRFGSLITAVPAGFMSAVCITYILAAPEGFHLSTAVAYPIGLAAALALFVLYAIKLSKHLHSDSLSTHQQ